MNDKVTVKVKVAADCENLLSALPTGYEYEITDEDYNDDGTGAVEFAVWGITDTTAAMEQALNAHPGVISYSVQ